MSRCFIAFVIYPVLYGLWLGHKPSLYVELFQDPIYQQTVVNTILYLVIGVNVKMFFALLLSGFFMRKGWWVKGLLMIYVLPWAVPALPTFISIHWMLNTNNGPRQQCACGTCSSADGPGWLDTSRWLALGSVIVTYIWKNMPFWTVILLAGRMAIPQELYEAAEVDGATGIRRFIHVSFPLLANLYLVCTLLSTVFTLGDFQHGLLHLGRRTSAIDAWPRSSRHPRRLRGSPVRAWASPRYYRLLPLMIPPGDDFRCTNGRTVGGCSYYRGFAPPRPSLEEAARLYAGAEGMPGEVAALALAVVIAVWTLAPIYNMVMVSLVVAQRRVLHQYLAGRSLGLQLTGSSSPRGYWCLEYFWHQYASGLYIGFWTVFLTLWHPRSSSELLDPAGCAFATAGLLTNAALMTYLVPASFLCENPVLSDHARATA